MPLDYAVDEINARLDALAASSPNKGTSSSEPSPPESSAASRQLLDGWVEELDPVSHKVYYLCERTGESSWTAPLHDQNETRELYQDPGYTQATSATLGDYALADRELPSDCCSLACYGHCPTPDSVKKQKAEQRAKQLADEEAARQSAEEELRRRAAAEAMARRLADSEEGRRAAEAQAAKLVAAESARVTREREEAALKAAREEAQRKAAEEGAALRAAEKAAEELAEKRRVQHSGDPEPNDPSTTRLVLLGFGAVNKTLLEIVLKKQQQLLPIRLVVVGVSDSGGACAAGRCGDGLDMQVCPPG